ncbi:Nif3-like dinuclear metal center hexameric protein [Bdellovibrionota bacterium FG-1]
MAKASLEISRVVEELERLAPSGTSEKWDNTGLLVGDPCWRTAGAVISVDLTAKAIETAVKRGYRLIVTHHPCIFPKSRGLQRLVPGPRSGISSLVFEAIRQGIAVACYHTNFDQCALEVVNTVSEGLGVVPRGRFLDSFDAVLIKMVVFVPESHAEKVRDALIQAGAGHIGHYDSCTFGTWGEGTFRGREGTHPFLGKPGQLEKVRELRLETVFPKGLKKSILSALRSAHPYEEIAYDLYLLDQVPSGLGVVRGLGYGFWGDFISEKSFSEVARCVKRFLNVNGFWLTDPTPKRVKRLAFVAGKGASFVEAAALAGCDLMITGEVGYHSALDGARKGMAILELGHRESEIFFIQTMKDWLSRMGLRVVGLNLRTQTIVTGR